VSVAYRSIGHKNGTTMPGYMMRNARQPPGKLSAGNKIIFLIFTFEIGPNSYNHHAKKEENNNY
jgi:hypothetical protein